MAFEEGDRKSGKTSRVSTLIDPLLSLAIRAFSQSHKGHPLTPPGEHKRNSSFLEQSSEHQRMEQSKASAPPGNESTFGMRARLYSAIGG